MAQTKDGWLWFGGSAGLTRFDGVEFEKIDVASGDGQLAGGVATLYALPSGGLVIGHLSGGVSILDRGVLRRFDSILSAGRPLDFVSAPDGTIWGSFERYVMRFDGTSWVRVGADWNLPDSAPAELFVDAAGTLWLHTLAHIFRLRPGSKEFEFVESVNESGALVQAQAGTMYYSLDTGGQGSGNKWVSGEREPAEASRKGSSAYFDREGNYWRNGWESPLPVPGVSGLERFGRITVFLEDSERNMWVAAWGEVHRLTRSRISPPLNLDTGTSNSTQGSWTNVVSDRLGRIWFTNLQVPTATNAKLQKWTLWSITSENKPSKVEEVEAAIQLAADFKGNVWVLAETGLWEHTGTGFKRRGDIPGPLSGGFTKLAAGCAGGVWAGVRGTELRRFDGQIWQNMVDKAPLPSATPTSLYCDMALNLWVGYSDGAVARLNSTMQVSVLPFTGQNIGAISSISVGRQTLIGGARGLAVWTADGFKQITSLLPVLNGVTGIVESPEGSVWVTTTRGLVRLWSADIDSASQFLGRSVRTELFDAGDGFPGLTMSLARPMRPIALDKDNRVWFAGHGGLASIDTIHIRPEPQTARLVIKSLSAGGESFANPEGLPLKKGTKNIEIAYTALHAQHPERLQFRYRLEGVDEGWINVAERRRANYTNLPPGRHLFHLDVSDEFGMWSNKPLVLSFSITPTFVETRMFQVLCAAGAVCLLALMFRLRVRQRERRLERYLVERHSERERIARDLHDTLLQGTQAFILKVFAATKLTAEHEPVHRELNKALDQATTVMVEARNRIEDLRSEPKTGVGLPDILIPFGEDLIHGSKVEFKAFVEGALRDVEPDVMREAGLVGREALLNAFYHGRPGTIELQISYTDETLKVSVCDDGCGFDLKEPTRAPGGKHWGLAGMHERAAAISSKLRIYSRPGLGTEVELSVPGATAYSRSAPSTRWEKLRTAFGYGNRLDSSVQ